MGRYLRLILLKMGNTCCLTRICQSLCEICIVCIGPTSSDLPVAVDCIGSTSSDLKGSHELIGRHMRIILKAKKRVQNTPLSVLFPADLRLREVIAERLQHILADVIQTFVERGNPARESWQRGDEFRLCHPVPGRLEGPSQFQLLAPVQQPAQVIGRETKTS